MEGDVAAVVDVRFVRPTVSVVDLRDHLVGDGARDGGHRRDEAIRVRHDGGHHPLCNAAGEIDGRVIPTGWRKVGNSVTSSPSSPSKRRAIRALKRRHSRIFPILRRR